MTEDGVKVAARAFADHRNSCRICSKDGPQACPVGLELLKDFQKALIEDAKTPPDR